MRFSLLSIKCSAAPSSFRLCCLNCTRRFDLITARSAVVGSWEEPPNVWLTVAKNAFVGWDLNFRVRMLLKSAVMFWFFTSQSRNVGHNSTKGPQWRDGIYRVLKGICRRVNIGNRYVPILTQPFVTSFDYIFFFHQNVKKFLIVFINRIIVNSRTFSCCFFFHLVHKDLVDYIRNKMKFSTHWL